MTEYDAKMVAADIVTLLREHLRYLSNEKTEKAGTSFRQNACGEWLSEAISVIAYTYDLDITDPHTVKVKP
jgi:hypothetical protein